jgi:hypothetical protein
MLLSCGVTHNLIRDALRMDGVQRVVWQKNDKLKDLDENFRSVIGLLSQHMPEGTE